MKGHMLICFFKWVGKKKGQGNWAWKNMSMNGINGQTSSSCYMDFISLSKGY
jgi:hypothetical protein